MSHEVDRRPRIIRTTRYCFAASAAFGAVMASSVANAAQSPTAPQSTTPAALEPMPADADPAFEVVSIKPSDRQSPHGTFFTTRGRHSIASNWEVRCKNTLSS